MKRKHRCAEPVPRPTLGNSDWNQHVVAVDRLEFFVVPTYHGGLQIRVLNRDTGEEKILTEPPKNDNSYN